MTELFDALISALRRGEDAVLCTILGATGSAPRGAGAKMAVFADGSSVGTVGGGAVELRSIAMAQEVLAAKQSLMHGGCGECQASCQSACKTSCTVANQSCANKENNAVLAGNEGKLNRSFGK